MTTEKDFSPTAGDLFCTQEASSQHTLEPQEKSYPLIRFEKDYLATFGLREAEARELLLEAQKNVFSMGVGDTAAQIGETVSGFFVAKMFYVQQKLNLPRYASVIHPPDATIQTYNQKFIRCVPEAAKIIWGSRAFPQNLIPGEIDIDFCGMIAVGMENKLSASDLAENISRMKRNLQFLDGYQLDTNCILPGNHFANIYEVQDNESFNLPPYIGFAHLSADEYRNRLREYLGNNACMIPTPFGECLAMVGRTAQQYWQIAQEGSAFARKKRELIAQEIFGSDYVVINDTHYEMIEPSSCLIGANPVNGEDEYHMIVSNPTEEAFIVRGSRGVPLSIVQSSGISSSNPLFFDLLRASVLPHGSGHCLPEDVSLKEVRFTQDGIFYTTQVLGGAERVTRHYQAVPNIPRASIMPTVLSYGLIDHNYAVLKPLCTVKA